MIGDEFEEGAVSKIERKDRNKEVLLYSYAPDVPVHREDS